MDDHLTQPPNLSWGIIGTGGIASAFAAAIAEHGSTVTAVASRSAERAAAFVERQGMDARSGTIDSLVEARPDVVYVGSSHHNHLDDALACLHAGIPVLCEKPLAMNSAETAELVELAKKSGIKLPGDAATVRLDSMIAVARAAERGLGAALVPSQLADSWFASGALVRLFPSELTTDDAFYFVCRRADEKNGNVALLREWALSQFRDL